MNYTNFFDFGVSSGDTQIESDGSGSGDAHSGDGSSSGDAHSGGYLDGNSPPIILSTPIQFFGTTQDTLFVSQLGLYFHLHTETIDDDVLHVYTSGYKQQCRNKIFVAAGYKCLQSEN